MGNEIVAGRSTELLAFNGHYSVPEDNDADRLLDDAGCFMGSAMALLKKELELADTSPLREADNQLAERLWGVYHLLQLVKGTTEAAHSRMSRQGGRHG